MTNTLTSRTVPVDRAGVSPFNRAPRTVLGELVPGVLDAGVLDPGVLDPGWWRHASCAWSWPGRPPRPEAADGHGPARPGQKPEGGCGQRRRRGPEPSHRWKQGPRTLTLHPASRVAQPRQPERPRTPQARKPAITRPSQFDLVRTPWQATHTPSPQVPAFLTAHHCPGHDESFPSVTSTSPTGAGSLHRLVSAHRSRQAHRATGNPGTSHRPRKHPNVPSAHIS